MIYTLTTVNPSFLACDEVTQKRTWGYYTVINEAMMAVFKNYGNMRDCLYDYLVIEHYEPGVIAIAKLEDWYKWENNRWICCSKPEWARGVVNWAMG